MASLATVDFLLVTESQRTALQPLAPADGAAASQCARAALDMLASDEAGAAEPPQTRAASCAAQLGCPVPDADAALHALAHTLASAARLNVTPEALADKLRAQALGDSACGAISAEYTAALPVLRAAAQAAGSTQLGGGPAFGGLRWRLDVRVGSRAARHEAVPSFLLQVDAVSGRGEVGTHFLEADFAQLSRLNDAVSAALRSAQSSRRLSRVLSR